jgi:hypothetical protein
MYGFMWANEKTIPNGFSSYRISGQIFRTIRNIRNAPDESPRCIQTYFYDHGEQASRDAGFFNGRTPLDGSIQQQLVACRNSYLISFLSLHEIVQNMHP